MKPSTFWIPSGSDLPPLGCGSRDSRFRPSGCLLRALQSLLSGCPRLHPGGRPGKLGPAEAARAKLASPAGLGVPDRASGRAAQPPGLDLSLGHLRTHSKQTGPCPTGRRGPETRGDIVIPLCNHRGENGVHGTASRKASDRGSGARGRARHLVECPSCGSPQRLPGRSPPTVKQVRRAVATPCPCETLNRRIGGTVTPTWCRELQEAGQPVGSVPVRCQESRRSPAQVEALPRQAGGGGHD